MHNIEFQFERPANDLAVRLTSLGFGKNIDNKFERDAIQVLDNCDGFVTASENCRLLGYIGYKMFQLQESNLLYMSTTMIEPELQGQGISGSLMIEAVAIEEPDYIGFRTQSARAYSAAKKIFSSIQPNLDDLNSIDHKLWSVGEELAELRSCTFPIIKGAYDSEPIYSEEQSNPRYSGFYEMINFYAGDALLCVGTIDLEKVKNAN